MEGAPLLQGLLLGDVTPAGCGAFEEARAEALYKLRGRVRRVLLYCKDSCSVV